MVMKMERNENIQTTQTLDEMKSCQSSAGQDRTNKRRNLMEDTLSQSGCVSTGAEQANRVFLDSFLWKLSVKLNLMEVTENTRSTPTDTHQKHFLHYKFTVLTKADTFPEFSAVGVCDDRWIKHFSDEERVWILTEVDWTEPPDPPDSRDWFIHQIRTLTNCTNSQCSELHVLQRIIGCELEKLPDGTVNLTVFDEYGFDGEDFISFNYKSMQWIDKNPKAKETKEKWDHQTGRNQFLKYFLKTCMNWISTFNNTKQTSPDVHVSVRKAPDDHSKLVLTCLATGFYPRDVQMNIRLNGNILEDQTSSGIRPNDDETFQMRISVKINRNFKGSYDCLVIHNSLTEPVSVKWGCGVQGFIIMFFLILWINVVHIEEREIVKHSAAHNNLRHKDMLTSGREETEQQRVFRMPKALSVL
ncbi:H-2 class I histocompatibility antigen, K-B alpha chain [Anabarilius grahami]|uniref:H-2 class I histocompatibility antigen, K-B alpha chain n=1 Tax=Anabarilius grahami TaxID=495550 RepID=A0A3N0XQL7_ANAGA|nr:H-2 class I histocompatibility antigen, K-B alpha chain [Anabarilius grahami]